MENQEQEIWKDVTGYEGLYYVSNLGRVKSAERVIFRGSRMMFCFYAQKNKKVVVDNIGNRYNSLTEAASSIRLDKSTLSKMLKGKIINKTQFKYE